MKQNNIQLELNGVKVLITHVSIENGIHCSIEEGEKVFEYPYDSSFKSDYENSNENDLLYAHKSIIENITKWATKERAKMVSKIVQSLVFLASNINRSQSKYRMMLSFFSDNGSVIIDIFNSKNDIGKRFVCQYLGINQYKTDDDYFHLGSVEHEIKKFFINKL